MVQDVAKQESILDRVQNLTPEQQEEVLNFIDFLQFKAQKQVNHQEQPQEGRSFLDAAKEFVGCVDSGMGDLSLKKKELKQGYKLICKEEY